MHRHKFSFLFIFLLIFVVACLRVAFGRQIKIRTMRSFSRLLRVSHTHTYFVFLLSARNFDFHLNLFTIQIRPWILFAHALALALKMYLGTCCMCKCGHLWVWWNSNWFTFAMDFNHFPQRGKNIVIDYSHRYENRWTNPMPDFLLLYSHQWWMWLPWEWSNGENVV